MKIYDIAFYLFIFNATLGFLNSLSIFDYQLQPSDYSIDDTMQVSSLSPVEFLRGMWILIDALAKATVLLPILLKDVGFPDVAVNYITGIVWFVYVAGVVQFILGRRVSRA